MTRVMFFCLGNICRSPLGEALFAYHVKQQGLSAQFEVQSSGTSAYHVGEAPDPGSQAVAMRRLGLDISDQRAQQLTSEHLRTFDVIVAMSQANIDAARRLKGAEAVEFLLLRDFEPNPTHRGLDTPDPWSLGQAAFEEVYEIVYRCTAELLADLRQRQTS